MAGFSGSMAAKRYTSNAEHVTVEWFPAPSGATRNIRILVGQNRELQLTEFEYDLVKRGFKVIDLGESK